MWALAQSGLVVFRLAGQWEIGRILQRKHEAIIIPALQVRKQSQRI